MPCYLQRPAISSLLMPNLSAIEELNSVRYVYLRKLWEPSDNSLKIVVEEAIVNNFGFVGHAPELDAVLKNASPIQPVGGGRLFELYWKSYAAYLVTEELVGSNAAGGYADECYIGTLLRVYTKSHFLAHIARDTGAHLGPLQHYKLVCLNHLIDVAAYVPPDVRLCGVRADAPVRAQ